MTVATEPVLGLSVPCRRAARAEIRAHSLAEHAEATRALLHGRSDGSSAKLDAAQAWLSDLDATEDEAQQLTTAPTARTGWRGQ